jgi:hemerythrin
MRLPFLPLGVPVMDADHAALAKLFDRVPSTQVEALMGLFEIIASEIRDHFAREEAVMEKAQVPVLHCHKTQHAALLVEVDAMRSRLPQDTPAMQRHLIGFVLARHVADHVAGVDQISSTFLLHEQEGAADRVVQESCFSD